MIFILYISLTNRFSTHATARGQNTTNRTVTGIQALTPKPTQPQMKMVVRMTSSSTLPSSPARIPITNPATTVKASICTPYLTIVMEVLLVPGTPSLYI